MELFFAIVAGAIGGLGAGALLFRRTPEPPPAAPAPLPRATTVPPAPQRLLPPPVTPTPMPITHDQEAWPDLVAQIEAKLQGQRLPIRQVERLVTAARTLAGAEGDLLRELARLALRAGNPAAGVTCIEAIPETQRTARDDLDAAILHLEAGHFIAALILLERLGDMEQLPSPARVRGLVARCATRLECPDPAPAFIEDARRDLYAATVTGAVPDEWFPPAVEAWMMFMNGDASSALSDIENLPDTVMAHPRWGRLQGDVLAALGRHGEAQDAWMRARDKAHPESYLYRTISRRIGDWAAYSIQDALPAFGDEDDDSVEFTAQVDAEDLSA